MNQSNIDFEKSRVLVVNEEINLLNIKARKTKRARRIKMNEKQEQNCIVDMHNSNTMSEVNHETKPNDVSQKSVKDLLEKINGEYSYNLFKDELFYSEEINTAVVRHKSPIIAKRSDSLDSFIQNEMIYTYKGEDLANTRKAELTANSN